MLAAVANPFEILLGLDGKGLNAGKVYIGVENQDPETNPQAVYWDAAGTIPAAQPLDTIGGYIWRAGTPARAYIADAYSIRVRDRLNNQVFYEASVVKPGVDSLDFIQAGTGAVTRDAQDKMRERFSPEDFGAVGDGVTDDTLAWTRVLTAAAGRPIVGDPSKTYGVSGNLALPAVTRIRDANFKQLSPTGIEKRTLYMSTGTRLELYNVKVDRNGDGSGGAVADSGGIYINDCDNVVMEDVEVTGNDKGSGIVLADCDGFRLSRPYVHDMIAGTTAGAAFTDDAINGIWIIRGGRGVIEAPRVENLQTRWTAQAAWTRFTRGIAVSGAADLQIVSPTVNEVDQGIDITGSDNPDRIVILGGELTNCRTWGGKCANTATYVRWVGVLARFCGLGGFVASGWTGGATQTSDILYEGCMSIGIGSNGYWAANSPAGFAIQTGGGAYTAYPRAIRYLNCTADGVGGAMKYGFLSDTANTGNGDVWNETINCVVRNHTVAKYSATTGIQQGICVRSRAAVQSIPNNNFTGADFDTTNIDRMNGASGTSLQVLIKKAGVYQVTGAAAYAASATGTRQLRLSKNGGALPGGKAGVPGSASGSIPITATALSACEPGDAITMELFQDSGGALNTVGGDVSLSVLLVNADRGSA